ncbi:MAG: hypothetical protein IJZ36_02570 [Bacilli bacterium]|nr:hypothetical protein [Bacilli bacterium]
MPNVFETPVVKPIEEVKPTVQPTPNIFDMPVLKPVEEIKPAMSEQEEKIDI